ncbi:hypothetical protein [uncultured Psychrosphaera sp.]|uniref:hypothetical protein n=1 Tax=uncultured Psychrosphaera sp. TaxID=1403522 RepID=UPI0026340684|nr:hypothetical protein [uncultured Psychrosphaera sp.]
MLNYDGWCRRIDLIFRAKFPYLTTRIFKISTYEYQLYVESEVDDFDSLERTFHHEIKYVTAPIKLVNRMPDGYDQEIDGITDKDIPSGFEGIPFTLNQTLIHISSVHSDVIFNGMSEDHENKKIIIEVCELTDSNTIRDIQKTAEALKCPYSFDIVTGNSLNSQIKIPDEVFNIAPSKSREMLSCEFLVRDERLWYDNVDGIYDGSFKKSDLYFLDQTKTSCLVNFSKFQNSNIRNHLLLYDVVYCVLPFSSDMTEFLKTQKITRNEILDLVKRGRLKIINMQPEVRLDYGFINEAYSENPSSVVSRRALAALAAIDLVELNESYIFSDPELNKYIYPLLKEISELTQTSVETISNYLLWPKHALRTSLDTLNQSGPMGIARYGVNKPIIDSWPKTKDKEKYEFEFVVNSDQIHLAHALDATYFPFYIDGDKYTDHPYALMMGGLLNFYKSASYEALSQTFDVKEMKRINNPSLSLISTFDINDYIPIDSFEEEISSSVVRKGMNSLFSELCMLDDSKRNERISEYNTEVNKALRSKNVSKHALDLGEDAIGMVVPFLATGKKLISKGTQAAMKKFPVIQSISEFVEDKALERSEQARYISLLSRVNRVARLKRNFT